MRARLWVLNLLFLSLSASADQLRLSDAEYEEIKEVSLTLRNILPEDKYSTIFVGRSPTAIQGFLYNFNFSAQLSLPLSNMKKFEESNEPLKKEKLFSHLNRFIPKVSDKVLVFFDYASSGTSFFALKKYLDEFMPVFRPGQKYNFAAMVWHGQKNLVNNLQYSGFAVIPLKYTDKIPSAQSIGPRFIDSLYQESYDDWSQYPKFSPWLDDSEKLAPRKEFSDFRAQFLQYMVKDPEINCRLLF